MTLKVIRRLQAFSCAIRQTLVQYFTRFQLTACSHGPSVMGWVQILANFLLCSVWYMLWPWVQTGSPAMGPNAGGVDQTLRISTNNSLYLENGTRETHSFYKDKQEVVCALLNGDIVDELGWPLTTPFPTISNAFHNSVTSKGKGLQIWWAG